MASSSSIWSSPEQSRQSSSEQSSGSDNDHIDIFEDKEIAEAVHEYETVMQQTQTQTKYRGRLPNHKKWEEARVSFEEFIRINGYMPKSKGKLIGEDRLYNWRQHQISQKNNRTLKQERIDALNLTEGWKWLNKKKVQDSTDDDSDNESSDEEVEEKSTRKHSRYSYSYISWDHSRKKWEEFYKVNKKIPTCSGTYSEEVKLYCWRNYQIKQKENNNLSADKIDTLNATDGWTWDRLSEQKTPNKRKFVEEDDIDEEEVVAKPAPKRQRLEIPWTAQREQEEFVTKISALEEQLKEKEAIIQRQLQIMERQYALIESLQKAQ